MTAKDICKEFEGLRLHAYRCPAGVWTIGYGHTRDVRVDQVLTEEQAEALLDQDLRQCALYVRQMVFKPINTNQAEALTDFIFNLGAGNFRGSTLLRKVNIDPNDPTIRDEFAKWVKAGGEVLPGLVRRREVEAELYFTPC
jgi:lysozyme